ncbi:polymorphic toxin-type HINT domain-containing protein [Actinoplanes sp. NPDC023936]|uniref:polymorphic toxin-type HINT domain-containing protein n=1 Tax=Actinoplanes sp. NPDC023936 TaxID=3154910 RepID=UPI00340C750C
MTSRWTRRTAALATVVMMTSATTAVSSPARAEQTAVEPADRSAVVQMWQNGGVLVAPAAEKALLGSDDDVRAFLDQVGTLQALDDRIMVNRVLAGGGPTVRTEAQEALDSGQLIPFLTRGWQAALRVDQRVRVNQIMAAGGTQLRAAAQKALDADAAATGPAVEEVDDSPQSPLDVFLASGWQKPFELDQRIKVNQILTKAPATSNVRRLAQRALDAGNVDALTSFLDSQHAIAAARDEEATAITDLVGAAERASARSAELIETAKEEGAKAAAAAAAAKASAQEALAAMRDAEEDAERAAAAARRAADAARKSADAAAQAIQASQAAVAAARDAAAAASRAVAAAAATRRAANRAYKAAADAARDKNKAAAALTAAADAEKAAALATRAADAVTKAEAVLVKVKDVVAAADSASANAANAAAAAEDALAQARATGVNVAEAEAAARRARYQAARANRAASASVKYAQVAATAAGNARAAATQAVTSALAAAKAAKDAAGHAGDATKAANAATAAANAASQAADAAITAANNAYAIYEAARAVDAERLAIFTEDGTEQARTELAAYQQYQARIRWDAQEAAKRNDETNRLIAEVRDPATNAANAVVSARKAALSLSRTAGPYTQQAAARALGGTDDEVVEFIRHGIDVAAARDDRTTVATMAQTGTASRRAAAIAALGGTDTDVARFLADQNYPERAVDDRVEVNRILAEAKTAGSPATIEQAQRALDGTDQDRRDFLATGQFQSAYNDDRIAANRMLTSEESGPELRAAAQIALDGTPGALHEFVTTGWYGPAQNDYDAVVHEQEMLALLARASNAATTAKQNAEEAQAVAAMARGKATEAQQWSAKAGESAKLAATYATKAIQSAVKAEESAVKAANSAKTAIAAAKVANQAASDAAQSVAVAQAAYRRARADASRAIDAAERARASALAAGKDKQEAQRLYEEAATHANKLIDQETKAAAQAAQDQFINCLSGAGPAPELQAECLRVFEPTDAKLGRAMVNKEFCNKFAQSNSVYYQNCVADTFNPNFMHNRAMDLLTAGALVFSQWGTVAMEVILGGALTLGCLGGLCSAAMAVIGGAEASMGIGGMFLTWAEGSLMRYAAGGVWSGVGGARLLGSLHGSINKIRIPAILQRVSTPQKAVDANFARLVSTRILPSCLRKNSFVAGTPVLLADGTSKAIENVRVGDRVLSTDPGTGVTDAQTVTDLITGTGTKNLVELTVDTGDSTATVTATDDHPFWVPDLGRWRKADELAAGQWLRTSAGTWVQITAVQHSIRWTTVHNLTVSTHHTYYVLAGDTSLLTHNDERWCDIEWQDLGDGWFESPSHLLYGPGSAENHRILHVLDHMQPRPDKPVHNVFDIGDQNVFELIDEAWLRRGTAVFTDDPGNRTYYIIPMGRRIGTKGETHILIIVKNGDEIITAYPKTKLNLEADD